MITPTMTATLTPTWTASATPTATPTITQTPKPVNLPFPINNQVKVSNTKDYYVGEYLLFSDGSIYVIVAINTTNSFINFSQEGLIGDMIFNSINDPTPGVLILSPIYLVTATPTMTQTPTPSITPRTTQATRAIKFTCNSKNPINSDNTKSILFIKDCLGYQVLTAFYKNKNLLMQLDAYDDGTILKPGYYKLVI
jgi:hypothetical protein